MALAKKIRKRRPKTNHHLYIGRAGHLAAMSECLSRGWNVAIPEVDVGEDIFVVEDATSKLVKVQVKTATGKKVSYGFNAQFVVPLKQIIDNSAKGNDLRFIFVVRFKKNWHPFIIMTRDELENKHLIEHIGSKTEKGEVKLTFYYHFDKKNIDKIEKVSCGTQRGYSGKGIPRPDITPFIDTWDSKLFQVRITEGN